MKRKWIRTASILLTAALAVSLPGWTAAAAQMEVDGGALVQTGDDKLELAPDTTQDTGAELLATVEEQLNQHMKSTGPELRAVYMKQVASLVEEQKLDSAQIVFYTECFRRSQSASEFVGYFNGMLEQADLYSHRVGASPDGSFDQFTRSRWVDSNDGTQRYYTYSGMYNQAIPKQGTPYTGPSAQLFTPETYNRVDRLLKAGYPLDLYNLAGQYAPQYDSFYKTYLTQEVFFMILGQIDMSLDDPYVKALYEYAVGTEHLEPVEQVTASFDSEVTLHYGEESGHYGADIPLHRMGGVDLVTITALPQGAVVSVSGQSVRVGDTFDPAEPIRITADGAEPIRGSLSVQYVSYSIVEDTLKGFTTSNLIYTLIGDEGLPYAPMVGYQMEPVYGNAELSSFLFAGGPVEPEKPQARLHFAYTNPQKEGQNVVSAPKEVQEPDVKTNESSFRYSDPSPIHGSGDIPEGYVFHGWYIDEGCTKKATGAYIVGDANTVYGYWTNEAPSENPEGPDEPDEPTPPVQPDEPEHPGGGGHRPTPPVKPDKPVLPDVPETSLPDEEPPLVDRPEIDPPEELPPPGEFPGPEQGKPEEPGAEGDLVILDPNTPLGNLPQTGDDLRAGYADLFGLAALLASVALTVFSIKQWKKDS